MDEVFAQGLSLLQHEGRAACRVSCKVLISGEVGSGKSRLMQELKER